MDKISCFYALNIPDGFVTFLLVFSFVVAFSPYLGGRQVGSVIFPDFSPKTKKILKVFGYIPFLIVVLMCLPILEKGGGVPW